MILCSIRLENFRNYVQKRFDFSPSFNLIQGSNAVGKTNLLESVFLLSGARSWRCRKDVESIRFGSASALIEGDIVTGERKTSIQMIFSHEEKKRISAGGVKLSSPRELLGKLPSVLFTPEDLQLLRGGPACRRRFMDAPLCQLYPRYLQLLLDYRKLQAGKTRILKSRDDAMKSVLPDYHRRLAVDAVEIARYRAKFIRQADEFAKSIHAAFAPGERLTLRYLTQVKEGPDAAEELAEHMDRRLPVEIRQGLCLVGIHRDDIEAEIGEKSARDFASQGQVRTAAISMKLAENRIIRDGFGEPPLLLLDDVLSELDVHRQEYLLKAVPEGQIFLTCCSTKGLVLGDHVKNILLSG